METTMQELLYRIKQLKYSEINEQAWGAYDTVMDLAEQLLEKEKEVMCQFADDFEIECTTKYKLRIMSPEQYYNITFKNE